jgi:hypothetical protein
LLKLFQLVFLVEKESKTRIIIIILINKLIEKNKSSIRGGKKESKERSGLLDTVDNILKRADTYRPHHLLFCFFNKKKIKIYPLM